MEKKIENIIKRFLTENEFEIDGNKIKFLYVEPYDMHSKMAFKFGVDITLPIKDQSYATPKFDKDIEGIFHNLWKYIGTPFSWSVEVMLINGEKPIDYVYISPQKQKELLFKLNEEYDRYVIIKKDFHIDFNISIESAKDYLYKLSDVQIEFYFRILCSSFTDKNNRPINPNMNKIDDLGAAISENMNDRDEFRSNVEGIIYDVLESELKINNVDDLYYNAMFYVDKIDGMKTSGQSWGVNLDRSQFM